MDKRLHSHVHKLLSSIIFIGIGIPCSADSLDYSNWNYYDLSRTAIELGANNERKAALEFFDKAVHADPSNPEGYINRGGMYELLHNSNQAIRDERHAIALAKSSSRKDIEFRSLAHGNLAGIYLDNKQLRKAEAEEKMALQLYPNSPVEEERLGDILREEGKTAEALTHFRKAQEIYKDHRNEESANNLNRKILQLSP